MTEPQVDVIVPLHDGSRPIFETVLSASSTTQGLPTRVLVVLHNLEVDEPQLARLAKVATVLRCSDGIRSPSGPRNVGIEAATAPFVFFLDSDDRLAANCLRRCLDAAQSTGADIVLPSIREDAHYVGTPLVASRRPRILDVVRHDLFSRSHVPALVRRQMLLDTGIRYPGDVRTGQDLVFNAQLYALGRTTVAFDAVYVIVDQPSVRVSRTPMSPAEQLAAVRTVLTSDWAREMGQAERTALARRVLSVNLAGGWRRKRLMGHELSAGAHAQMRDLAVRLAPMVGRWLSVRDRVSLRFALEPTLVERILMTRVFGLVPASLAGFGPRGPIVSEARRWVVRHRRRKTDLPASPGR